MDLLNWKTYIVTLQSKNALWVKRKNVYIKIRLDTLWDSLLPLDIMNEKGMQFSIYAADFWKS